MKIHTILTGLVTFMLTGCLTNWTPAAVVVGSKISMTQAREVEEFNQIKIEGIVDVSITIGSPRSVTVTTDDNLIDHVRTGKVGEFLEIDTVGFIGTELGIQIDVVVPELITIDHDGVGTLQILDFQGETLKLISDGVGDISIQGTVGRLNVTSDGIGDVNLSRLTAREATVLNDGIGDVTVHATDLVDAKLEGIGDIKILGLPQKVLVEDDGVGDIIQ